MHVRAHDVLHDFKDAQASQVLPTFKTACSHGCDPQIACADVTVEGTLSIK